MLPERMQELLVLMQLESLSNINHALDVWCTENYDTNKINERYKDLLMEFLTPYALYKTEKSD